MATPTLRPDAPIEQRLLKAADAAWERYASTVRLGGTPEQRYWAFDQAMVAERRTWSPRMRAVLS